MQPGQTAGIGFWNNKNGQALIQGLTRGIATARRLAGGHPPQYVRHRRRKQNLTGKSNADVAALFQQDFLLKGVKLDAQVLATALSVYVSNATWTRTRNPAKYGFTVERRWGRHGSVNVGTKAMPSASPTTRP